MLHTYMHVCVHTYIHIYIHTYIHTYMHTSIHTHTHTYMHTYIHTPTCRLSNKRIYYVWKAVFFGNGDLFVCALLSLCGLHTKRCVWRIHEFICIYEFIYPRDTDLTLIF